MPAAVIEFDPEARAEVLAAEAWYTAKGGLRVSDQFLAELRECLAGIVESPLAWPEYFEGTRRRLLGRFPYSVVYRLDPDRILVVAVAHLKRRPGYWLRR